MIYIQILQILWTPDCACKKGEIHYFGCDMERCPNCGEQLLVCCCDIATEEDTMCIIVQ